MASTAQIDRRRRALILQSRQRTLAADKWLARVRAIVRSELRRQAAEAARLAGTGSDLAISAAMLRRWQARLARAIRPLIQAMAAHGYALAGSDVGGGGATLRHKIDRDISALHAKADIGYGGDVGPGAWDEFVLQQKWPSIDQWVATTAESASKTSASRLTKYFTEAAEFWDHDKKRGLTPREIAQRIWAAGETASESRAEMLARTGSIWAYGEGAMNRYDDAGVAVVEWLTAYDDLACPFCADMNGKKVATGDNFFAAGDVFPHEENDGNIITLKIGGARGMDVKHPPCIPAAGARYCR